MDINKIVAASNNLHPGGPTNPFERPARGHREPSIPVTHKEVLAAVKKIAKDTSGGISGWTPHLFRLAFKKDSRFSEWFISFVHQVYHGSAPGSWMWCASALTLIPKKPTGVRPIAVGELFYRIAAKVILKACFHRDMLLRCQLGVMSKGGVEPIVRLWERAMEDTLDRPFTHGLQLDCKNAFNTLDRRAMAVGIREHAPAFWPAAKWAYNEPRKLYVRGQGEVHTIMSEQGIRQGDPFGPLFFSLGFRRKVQELQDALGPESLVTAYLDDITILTSDPNFAMSQAHLVFVEGSNDIGVRLNLGKCKEDDFKRWDCELTVLGSYLGSHPDEFLREKIQKELQAVARLDRLPAHHAQLLLRWSLQHRLRHLLRTLPDSDILLPLWRDYDRELLQSLLKRRGRLVEQQPLDGKLAFLPISEGGLGLGSHADIAPHARAASIETSDDAVTELMGQVSEHSNHVSQTFRCMAMYQQQAGDLVKELDENQAVAFLEGKSLLSSRWLYAIPFTKFQTLSVEDVAAGLYARTLQPGFLPICTHCYRQNSLGHHEVCEKRSVMRTARHEGIKKGLAIALRKIKGTTVIQEPRVTPGAGHSSLRTDLRVTGPGASFSAAVVEIDVTVVSLFSQDAMAARDADVPEHWEKDARMETAMQKHLGKVAQEKINKYKDRIQYVFHPFVLSPGGYLHKETDKLLTDWHEKMEGYGYGQLLIDLSIGLIRNRAHCLVL